MWSNLFHRSIVEGKSEFLNEVVRGIGYLKFSFLSAYPVS